MLITTAGSKSAGLKSSLYFRVAAGFAAGVVAAVLAGCGAVPGASSAPADAENVLFSGKVHGGQQAVTGANIALFATTSGGYGGTLTPLASTTTDGVGNFDIKTSYTCPSGQQAYIVATGGNPGLTGTVNNAAIFLVAALGPCTGISASTLVDIDEVTTVAAAYALSGFLPAGGAGITEAAVVAGTAMPGVTTSATNTQGLKDAFLNANNIVDTANGLAYATTPGAGSNGVVPQATIHALADILQPCVNSTGADSNCSNLFTAAQPPTGTGIAKPVNVFQAALDIAQYPGNNVATLFGLLSSQPAFPTSLTTAPNDWTIGITYTSPLLVSGTGLGVDKSDNVYVSGAGYLLEFSPQGLAPTANLLANDVAITTSDSLREIAFDNSGNLFVTDGAATGVYEYNPTTTAATLLNFDVSPVSEANNNTYGVAVDADGDVWTSSYSKSTCASVTCPLVEFAKGAAYAPFSTFSSFTASQPTGALGGSRGTAFDVNTGNVWVTAIDDNLAEIFKVTPSTTGAATASAAPIQVLNLGTEAGTPSSNTAYGTISVAVDSTSRGWIVVAGGAAVTGSKATGAIPAALYPVSATGTVGTALTNTGLTLAAHDVIDGNNNVFVANVGPSTSGGAGDVTNAGAVVEYSPGFNSNAGGFLSGTLGFNPGATNSAGSLTGGSIYQPSYVAVDRAGALWMLSSGSGTAKSTSGTVTDLQTSNLVQILGVAAPVNPVLAAGQYGVKP